MFCLSDSPRSDLNESIPLIIRQIYSTDSKSDHYIRSKRLFTDDPRAVPQKQRNIAPVFTPHDLVG